MNADNRAQRRAHDRTTGTTRRRRKATGLSLLALTGLVSAYAQILRSPSAYATGITCTVSLGTDTGSGSTGTAGDLRDCIVQANANAGSTIDFTTSVQLTSELPNLTGATTFSGNGYSVSGGRDTSTVFRMFTTGTFAAGDTLAISNLTIRKFKGSGAGGALYVNGAGNLTLSQVTMSDNYASGIGGAIYDDDGSTVSITNSTFLSNYSRSAGGAANFDGNGPVTITNSTFRSNVSRDHGGALYTDNGSQVLTITGSTFDGNSTVGGRRKAGGALYERSARSVTITDSTFTNNSSDTMAAIALESYNVSAPTISGSTFSGNTAAGQGIVVYLGFSSLSATSLITNSSFTGNSSVNYGMIYAKGDLKVTNSFIGGNTATVGSSAITARANLDLNFTTIAGNSGVTAAIIVNPRYTSPAKTLTVKGSVIEATGVACAVTASTPAVIIVDDYSVATDATCALTGANSVQSASSAAIALEATSAFIVNGVSRAFRNPGTSSILRSGAPSTNLGVANASPDELGTARSGSFVIGSVQLDPTPAPAPAPAPTGGAAPAPAPTSAATPTPTPTPTASPSAVAVIDPLDPIVNADNSNLPAGTLPAGSAVLLVNGVPARVIVKPNAKSDATALVIEGPDLRMRLEGRGDDSDPLGLTSKQALILQSEEGAPATRAKKAKVQPVAKSAGSGFKAASPVKFYILPGTYLGTITTDANGAYNGSVPIPPGIPGGVYALQANGFAPDGSVRSLSIGVLVTTVAKQTTQASAKVYFDVLSPVLTADDKATLEALVKKTGTKSSRTVAVGYVQGTSTTSNDQTLSTQRARNVAAYLQELGLKGPRDVRGDGIATETGAMARRVNVTVTYVK